MITVSGDDPFEFAIVFTDDEGPELIDVYCLAFEAVLQCPDLHPAFESRGEAFPFPDDCLVFAALDQEIMVLEFPEDACEEGSPVHFVTDFSADGGDIFLHCHRELADRDIRIYADAQQAVINRVCLCSKFEKKPGNLLVANEDIVGHLIRAPRSNSLRIARATAMDPAIVIMKI